MRKKVGAFFLLFVFMAGGISFSACGKKEAIIIKGNESLSTDKQQAAIKIGAVYPLSGPLASYGVEYKRGLEMAAEEINTAGGVNGKTIELIFEDDSGNTVTSVNAVNKLINIDKVKYLFTAFSSPSQATAPIAEDSKVLYISATVSKIGTGNYVFRDYWDMTEQGKATGKVINKEGFKKVSILALNYSDTIFFLKGLKSQAQNVKFLEESFNFGEADFKTQLMKIKSFSPDAIFVYVFPGAEAIKITNQLKELNLDNKRLLGMSQYGVSFMYNQFPDLLLKMKLIDAWYSLDPTNPKTAEFIKKYKNKYGQDLSVGDTAYPYDDLYALKLAIENAKTDEDPSRVANELRKVKLNGVAGNLSFDEKGNSERPTYFQTYTENGWQKYDLEK